MTLSYSVSVHGFYTPISLPTRSNKDPPLNSASMQRAAWALCSSEVEAPLSLFRTQCLRGQRHSQRVQRRWISQGGNQRQYAAASMEAMQAEYAKRNSSTLYAIWCFDHGHLLMMKTGTMVSAQVSQHWLSLMQAFLCIRWSAQVVW